MPRLKAIGSLLPTVDVRIVKPPAGTETGSQWARPQERGSTTTRGYGWKWQKLRKRKLAANPLCEQCEATGRVAAAVEVDHRTPRAQGGTDAWDNLQSLCEDCHKAKTAREGVDGRGDTAKVQGVRCS